MTIRQVEGFEWSATAAALADDWLTATFGTSAVIDTGRHFGNALYAGTTLTTLQTAAGVIPNQATAVVGMALYVGSDGTTDVDLITLLDGANEQLKLRIVNGTGSYQFEVKRGATVLETSPSFAVGAWRYIEFKVVTHDTTGSYSLVIDGTEEAGGTGIDTDNQNTGNVDGVRITTQRPAGGDVRIDDIYILDGAGTIRNDVLGDQIVAYMVPEVDGTFSEFAPSTGIDNYATVDEVGAPNDADYNSTALGAQRDTFGFTAHSVIGGTINAVIVRARAKLSQAGSRELKALYYDGVEKESAAATVNSTSWANKAIILEQTPGGTPVDFVVANIDAQEFGYKTGAAS